MSEHEGVSEAFYVWFMQRTEKGIKISGKFLKTEARQFYETIFTASEADYAAGKRDTYSKIE